MLNKLKAIPHEIIFAIAIFIMISGIATGRLFILICGVLLVIIARCATGTFRVARQY